ncbi:MAG: hypothetical protein Q8Q15_03980 [bacterium]|nr:hypothetical protein [bacterium]
MGDFFDVAAGLPGNDSGRLLRRLLLVAFTILEVLDNLPGKPGEGFLPCRRQKVRQASMEFADHVRIGSFHPAIVQGVENNHDRNSFW